MKKRFENFTRRLGFGVVGRLEFGVVEREPFGVVGREVLGVVDLLAKDAVRRRGKRCGDTVRFSDPSKENTRNKEQQIHNQCHLF